MVACISGNQQIWDSSGSHYNQKVQMEPCMCEANDIHKTEIFSKFVSLDYQGNTHQKTGQLYIKSLVLIFVGYPAYTRSTSKTKDS